MIGLRQEHRINEMQSKYERKLKIQAEKSGDKFKPLRSFFFVYFLVSLFSSFERKRGAFTKRSQRGGDRVETKRERSDCEERP
jgi:hypothetical protein